MADSHQPDSDARVVEDTRRWVERAVIGLNLCPFAKAVQVKGQVRYAVSRGATGPEILVDLDAELARLASTDSMVLETTLLILPFAFGDFLAYSDFLRRCDSRLRRAGLLGQIQLASFHPDYQFADADQNDVANCTNRSPYPTLHLLREDSIARAVDSFPQPESIYEANILRLKQLGLDGWRALGVGKT